MTRVLVVAGTRPEAIKLAPVVHALARERGVEPRLCVTGQHREMLDEVLALFGLAPDHDLDLPRGNLAPGEFVGRAMLALGPVIADEAPDIVLVQGDTATALAAATAAFHARVPIGHVEAGLRTGDMASPFPEEGYRKLIAQLAALHFAPSVAARNALKREGVAPSTIFVVGNTGVDALLAVARRIEASDVAAATSECYAGLGRDRPLILVTTHRRENQGDNLDAICEGIARIAARENADILMPLHPNPAVSRQVRARLGETPNVRLIGPLDYPSFVWLLRTAALALTDSGGVQEEGPALGTPVLVMRDTTERPEGIEAGVSEIVGTNPDLIAAAVHEILHNPLRRAAMSRRMRLYGGGDAAPRIARIVARTLNPKATMPERVAA